MNAIVHIIQIDKLPQCFIIEIMLYTLLVARALVRAHLYAAVFCVRYPDILFRSVIETGNRASRKQETA